MCPLQPDQKGQQFQSITSSSTWQATRRRNILWFIRPGQIRAHSARWYQTIELKNII